MSYQCGGSADFHALSGRSNDLPRQTRVDRQPDPVRPTRNERRTEPSRPTRTERPDSHSEPHRSRSNPSETQAYPNKRRDAARGSHHRSETPARPASSRPAARPAPDPPLNSGDNTGDYNDELLAKPLEPRTSAEFVTPDETVREVLMTPQSYGVHNRGIEDENDLDIPTYLRNMRKMKK